MKAKDEDILRSAHRAALSVLGDRSVFGKDAMDFAVDAWIYVEERQEPKPFVPLRARYMALDGLRKLLGRSGKSRKRLELEEYKDFRGTPKADPKVGPIGILLDTSLPDTEGLEEGKFKTICQGLAMGYSRTEVAKRFGLAQTRITQIIDKHKHLLSCEDPKCRSKAKRNDATCSLKNLPLQSGGQQSPKG